MPLLPTNYVSSWYHLLDKRFNLAPERSLIVQSHTETQERTVNQKLLLQGDIGVHVMEIGGYKWKTQLNSPVLVIRDDGLLSYNNQQNNQILSVLDLISFNLNLYRDPIAFNQFVSNYNSVYNQLYSYYIMQNAILDITPEKVNCNVTLLSDFPDLFPKIHCTPSDIPTFIGREAKWFDTFLHIGWAGLPDETVTDSYNPPSGFAQPSTYQILSGKIDIKIQVKEFYVVGQRNHILMNDVQFKGNTPIFAITGYMIEGNFKAMAQPNDPILQINPELPNCFYPRQGIVALNVGWVQMNFGEANVQGSITRNMNSDDLTTIDVTFKSFANINSTIEANNIDPYPCTDSSRYPLF